VGIFVLMELKEG